MARSSALTDADSSEDYLSKKECKMAPEVQASRYAVAIHSRGEQHEVKENYSYLQDECYVKVSFMLRSGFRSYPNDFSSKDHAYQKYENRIYCVVTSESKEPSRHAPQKAKLKFCPCAGMFCRTSEEQRTRCVLCLDKRPLRPRGMSIVYLRKRNPLGPLKQNSPETPKGQIRRDQIRSEPLPATAKN